MTVHDLVLDVGITGGRVAAVGPGLEGRRSIDARGRVVAPGFVDLHSHCEDVPGLRSQAFDGVATALELEIGMYPVEAAYRRAALAGRPISYGFSTSWAAARLQVVDGVTALSRKGRLAPGADADVVVFDPDTVTDNATYTDTVRPTTGFEHVLVHGGPVISDGELVPDALPGRPVRA